MPYSIYNFLRNTKEKTKALDQMASYIHHNTDMKVYLFLTLENYAEFEAIQEHHHGRIVWAVNAADTGPFGALDPYSFDGLVEFDGKDVDIDPGGAFYSTDISFDGLAIMEAYSAAGEIGFGWWLVEHYLPYHVDCPNGCGLGEPTRGRKYPPGFQMGYGSFDNIPDLVDPFVESFLPLQ